MSISDKPIVRRRRWTHTSSRNSFQAAAESIFFFFAAAADGGPAAALIARALLERSALRMLGAPERSRAINQLSAFGTASVNGAIRASNSAPSGLTI